MTKTIPNHFNDERDTESIMNTSEMFEVIDTHTEGEPTRILMWNRPTGGAATAHEAREFFREQYDYLRTAILHEPRGHSDQFGAVVMPSPEEGTDFMMFFTTTSGYLDMCGHATIGVSTALVELGLVPVSEPETVIEFDTPAGHVKSRVHVEGGKAVYVTVIDVTSYYEGEKQVKVGNPLNRKVHVNLSYGGNFYAIVDSRELGTEVLPENIDELRTMGKAISESVYEQYRPTHPTNSEANAYPLTMITGTPQREGSDHRNVVIFSDGSFDRSPCGTGTASRAAMMFSKGQMDVGDSFVHESINSTTFRCRIAEKTRIGHHDAIVPEITGRAWVTQISKILMDPDDPMKNGFLVK